MAGADATGEKSFVRENTTSVTKIKTNSTKKY
jgi:hypothetical protein